MDEDDKIRHAKSVRRIYNEDQQQKDEFGALLKIVDDRFGEEWRSKIIDLVWLDATDEMSYRDLYNLAIHKAKLKLNIIVLDATEYEETMRFSDIMETL
jgi:hypothetical protein